MSEDKTEKTDRQKAGKAARPMVLLILDGWGYSETIQHNAIAAARKPVWDRLWSKHPHTLIRTSGAAVGLPADQMGNSEVGHLNLGAGRVVYQEFTRVSRAIKTGSFFNNHTLTEAVDAAKENGKAVHILGLLSTGGVHSHEDHIHAMVELAVERGAEKVYLHAFLDGRDTPPRSASSSIEAMQAVFDRLQGGHFASVIGRYYAMDRDQHWERIRQAYDLITLGESEYTAATAQEALDNAYARDESDEFVKATAIVPPGGAPVKIEDGDVLTIDAEAREINASVSDEELARRRSEWKRPLSPVTRGVLAKYRNEVSSASEGAVTIPPAWDK